jgi:hypothetical protein
MVLGVKGRVTSALVDSFRVVLALPWDGIKDAPRMSAAVDTSYLTGIAEVSERMLVLVDIEALMTSADMDGLKRLRERPGRGPRPRMPLRAAKMTTKRSFMSNFGASAAATHCALKRTALLGRQRAGVGR